MSITYAQLNQRHPSLDYELAQDRLALYRGGAAVRARARRFLEQRPNEPDATYQTRLREMIFEPHMGTIISHFANMIWKSKPVAVATIRGKELHDFESAYYGSFKSNADHSDSDIDVLVKALFVDAAVTGLGWLLVHDPIDDSGLEPAQNKAQWEARGLGNFWVEKLDYSEVIDWELDSDKNLLMAVVHRVQTPRLSAESTRSIVRETWQVYSHMDVETFAVEYDAKNAPKPDDLIESVSLRSHPFGRVPLLCLEFGPSQHLAARLETPQLAHALALNAENWALGRSAFAQILFNSEDPNGFTAPTMASGVGIVVGINEKASWLEPAGTALDALNRAKKDHMDSLYRVASAMALGVENNAASVGRSAESKAIDNESSRVALRSFAEPVREIMGRLYAMIASARGDQVTWRIDGLDDLDVVAYLQALKLLRDGLDGPAHSPGARAALESRAVEAMVPDATPEQKQLWRAETTAGVLNDLISVQPAR
jgi:hypothetical protein